MTGAAYGKAQFKTAENKEAFEYKDATKPYEFQSTSAMSGSGSNLPLAARDSEKPDSNDEAQTAPRPYKAPPITGGEDMPIGDGVWVLMVLATVYAFGKLRHRWHPVP